MITGKAICLVIAVILFVLASVGIGPPRVDLKTLAFAFVTLSFLI